MLVGGFIFALQHSKELTLGEILEGNHFTKDGGFSIQKISEGKIIPLQTTESTQKNLGRAFENLTLLKSDELYPALDADYIISPSSHPSQKAYVFLDENVIVFSEKTRAGYVIQNKDFTQSIKKLLD